MTNRLMTSGIIGVCALLSTLPLAALAQTANDSLAQASTEFRGTAPSLCIIRGPATVRSSNNATLASSTTNAATIDVTTLVAQNGTGIPNAADMQVAIPVICTITHEVSVQSASGGMTRLGTAGPATAGFRTLLDYSVQTAWAGQNNNSQASALPAVIKAADAATGDLLVTISIPQGGQPLVAGSYADTLTILLTPTL